MFLVDNYRKHISAYVDSGYQAEASDWDGFTSSPQLDSQMAPLKREGPPANDPDQRDATKQRPRG